MWNIIKSLMPMFVVIFLFFLLLPLAGDREMGKAELMARSQFAIRSAAQVLGLLIAIAALMVLLHRAKQSDTTINAVPAGLCVVGGILLFESHWVIVVTFGAIVIAQVLERILARQSTLEPASPTTESPI